MIGSKTTDECGDEWRRVHTSGYCTGDEYIRVGIVQETSTYECLEVRRRVPRGQQTSTYDRRREDTCPSSQEVLNGTWRLMLLT